MDRCRHKMEEKWSKISVSAEVDGRKPPVSVPELVADVSGSRSVWLLGLRLGVGRSNNDRAGEIETELALLLEELVCCLSRLAARAETEPELPVGEVTCRVSRLDGGGRLAHSK